MSKKHFEAMAAEIQAMRAMAMAEPEGSHRDLLLARANGAEDLILAVAPGFNANFNAERFVAACQP